MDCGHKRDAAAAAGTNPLAPSQANGYELPPVALTAATAMQAEPIRIGTSIEYWPVRLLFRRYILSVRPRMLRGVPSSKIKPSKSRAASKSTCPNCESPSRGSRADLVRNADIFITIAQG